MPSKKRCHRKTPEEHWFSEGFRKAIWLYHSLKKKRQKKRCSFHVFIEPTHMALKQRCMDVETTSRRWNNVVLTSCTGRVKRLFKEVTINQKKQRFAVKWSWMLWPAKPMSHVIRLLPACFYWIFSFISWSIRTLSTIAKKGLYLDYFLLEFCG